MRCISNKITTAFVVILLLSLVLVTKVNSTELRVMCYIEEEGRGFPCLMNEQGEFYWDGKCHTDYKVQSTYMNEHGTLYVILVQKED